MKKTKISIIIPVFNNSKSLEVLSSQIIKCLKKIDFEIIFVNDFSSDDSKKILKKIYYKFKKKIKIFNLYKNFGEGYAIMYGIKKAKSEYYITLSADLEDNPFLIKKLYIKAISKNLATIIYHRKIIKYKITSLIFFLILKKIFKNFPTNGFNFCGFSNDIKKIILKRTKTPNLILINILRFSKNIEFVSYKKKKRIHGKSQYNFIKRLSLASNILFELFLEKISR